MRFVRMGDSRVESDKLEFTDMENTSTGNTKKYSDWLRHLPLGISLLAILLILGTIIGVAIHISNLTSQIDRLHTSLNTINIQTVSKTSTLAPAAVAQQQKAEKSTEPSETEKLVQDLQQKLNDSVAQIGDLKNQLDELRRNQSLQLQIQQEEFSEAIGTTYTRWGKLTCPNETETVYTGFGAGSVSSTSAMQGGGAQYLCLPEEPEWNKFDLRNDSLAFSWLYAAEFRTTNLGIFPDQVHGSNMHCSVCRAKQSSQMMMAGKRSCPDTWTKQYEGYLMSSNAAQNKMSFICVDEQPDVMQGSQNVTGGATLYFVSAACSSSGGLYACPPYVHARELTCVVCSK